MHSTAMSFQYKILFSIWNRRKQKTWTIEIDDEPFKVTLARFYSTTYLKCMLKSYLLQVQHFNINTAFQVYDAFFTFTDFLNIFLCLEASLFYYFSESSKSNVTSSLHHWHIVQHYYVNRKLSRSINNFQYMHIVASFMSYTK